MTRKMAAACKSTGTVHAVNENVAHKRLLARVRALMRDQAAVHRKCLSAFHAVNDHIANKRLFARVRALMNQQLARCLKRFAALKAVDEHVAHVRLDPHTHRRFYGRLGVAAAILAAAAIFARSRWHRALSAGI